MNTKFEHPLYESPMRERNEEKFGQLSNQCICCCKPMADSETKMVHMNTNWNAMHVSIKDETDASINGFQSQGYFPIGNTCAAKMPKSFIHSK